MATRPIEKEIDVDAPRERVWEVLTGEATYRRWSAEFAEGSYAETDWQQGSSVRFLGPDGTGLVGRVLVSRRPELLDIEYTGVVGGGRDDTESEQARLWSGTHEMYRLAEAGGGTLLAISAPMEEAYYDEMVGAWDRALAVVKELSRGAG
ncbi:SRPBCC family protein [Kineococcus radiotolerans]|uniref:Activator of Hsp90 ATPase 1 family protein n=1 Tax=Kineococcus radiotolerans (strain ATCC BAA-149 / DSM 14245 / SRS30216) TaxID=266940 RepID=A6WAR1_KINRD|nr:SRPBCC domain-containing protein [Kineococcus radiotolerans]ABS03900.1 Activator of Hsp90 ATPase 1 family protein [Kineococcus radiotolerans SRS30216 = ATCC BAA-149]